MKALCRTKNFSVFRINNGKFIVELRDVAVVYRNRIKFAMVPFFYSGTEGRSCSFIVIGVSLLWFRLFIVGLQDVAVRSCFVHLQN